ncbi:MAG: hypothetical protein ACI8QS_002005 [Planctomycetota bacterium]|jgi:hypothetical protein
MNSERKTGGVTERANWLTPESQTHSGRSHRPAQRFLAIVFLCALASFVVAVVFTVILIWSLPPTDVAYASSPFSHPMILGSMLVGAGLSCLVVVPFAFSLLWKGSLWKPLVTSIGVSLLAVVLLTPVIAVLAWPLSLVAAVIAMYLEREIEPVSAGRQSGL